jgi:hypothetical protein
MFDYHEKNKGHKNVLPFFSHGLSLRYFKSYEETLEKKKGIEKNEFE